MKITYQQNIISSLLVTPSLLAECDLAVEEFDETSGLIYQAMLDLESSNVPIDVLTVADHLDKSTGRNYLPILGELTKEGLPTKHASVFKNYVSTVRQQFRIQRSKEVAQNLLDYVEHKGMEAVDEAIKELMSLSASRKNYECHIVEALKGALDDADKALNGEKSGLPTGVTKLDNALGGLHNSDLIIVGARPSIGKTAFMMNLALAAKKPIGIISTEQGRNQIGQRTISLDAKVSLHNMRIANLEQSDWSKMAMSLSRLKDAKIWLNDKPSATVNDILRQARKWKQLHDIQGLYVDYIQHIPGDKRLPRHLQVEETVVALKNVARELDIPVIALAQINRGVEDRPDKRPYMSDLKDSGSIEQEADQILLLYRDDVYNDPSEKPGIIEIDIKKNRHGPIGRIDAAWIKEYLMVQNLDTRYS